MGIPHSPFHQALPCLPRSSAIPPLQAPLPKRVLSSGPYGVSLASWGGHHPIPRWCHPPECGVGALLPGQVRAGSFRPFLALDSRWNSTQPLCWRRSDWRFAVRVFESTVCCCCKGWCPRGREDDLGCLGSSGFLGLVVLSSLWTTDKEKN